MLYLLSLLFLICGVNLLYVAYNGIDLGIMAVALLLLALVTLSLGSIINDYSQLINYLAEGKIRQKEEELKHIGESIDLFYLPLLDLLTTYDENVASRAKTRRVAEINGRKHLAEPGVRSTFEKYIQTNDESNRESKKLLELVNKDIEFLQNRFIEFKLELKDE